MSIQIVLKKLALSLLIAGGAIFVSLPAQAAMVGTAEINNSMVGLELNQAAIRQKREWIHQQLLAHGVSPADSRSRVDMLSDSQVVQIHQKIDEMPAGAGIGGVILVVFIVLVITDLMGATDIFPFIRPMD
jgi:hypothetical protein